MCKVSIVVPIYNMEKYFDECIQSILSQSLKDIEVICVDDGSTDSSLQIMKRYAEKDCRIRIIQKKNSGYGDSVNKGMEVARGKYIGIVEPDDYIDPKMMEVLYNTAKKHELDAVYSNHIRFFDCCGKRNCREEVMTREEKLYNIVLNAEKDKSVFGGNYLNPTGLFRRAFLEHEKIYHNTTPGASYQDIGFCFQILAFSKRIQLIDKAFYYYRQDNPNSSIASKAKMDCVINEYQYIYDILKHKGKLNIFLAEYNKRRYGSYLYTFERLAWDLKAEFLDKISVEYLGTKLKEELDVSALSIKGKKDIELIMYHPQKFYDRYEKLRSTIYEQIKSSECIIIYGAGVIGKKVYDLLDEKEQERVLGFAVTQRELNNSDYKNKKIDIIQSYENSREYATVLISVTEKHTNEIVQVLDMYKFKKYVILGAEVTCDW